MDITLRPIAECVRKVSQKVSASNSNDQFLYIDLSSIDKDEKRIVTAAVQRLSWEDAPSRARQIVQSGDILVSTVRPNLNGVAQIDATYDGAIASTGFCVLRTKPEVLDSRYLFHWLCSPKFVAEMVKLATGASYPAISDRIIHESLIPLPIDVIEQRRIATILDKADAICRKRREAINLADEFLRSVFLDMFGNPATNSKGWPFQPLGSLCQVQTGATPNRDKPDYYGGDIPWVKTGEVDQELIIDSEEKITESGLAETNCKVFPIGTILIAMYGQGKTRGKCGILGVPASTNQACAALLPSDSISNTYLFYLLRASYESIRAMARGGNQENLNLAMIKGLDIPLPPETLQKRFAAIVKKTANMKTAQNNALQEAKSLFASASAISFCRQIKG